MTDFSTRVQTILDYKPPRRKKVALFYGDKMSSTCPDCNRSSYGYHGGVFKSCTSCLLHNFMEDKVRFIKRAHKFENLDKNNQDHQSVVEETYDYVEDRRKYSNGYL